MAACVNVTCGKTEYARGLCEDHFQTLWRSGVAAQDRQGLIPVPKPPRGSKATPPPPKVYPELRAMVDRMDRQTLDVKIPAGWRR